MKKCPICSEIIPDYMTSCTKCGHVFVAAGASMSEGTVPPTGSQSVSGATSGGQTFPPGIVGNHGGGGSTIGNRPVSGTKGKRPIVATLLIALGAIAALCAGYFVYKAMSSSVLDEIPAESDFVMVFDGEQILKSAGCKMSGGELELSDALNKLVKRMDADEVRLLDELKQADCFDFDKVVFVANMRNDDNEPDYYESYVVLPVDNQEKAVEFFEDAFKKLNFSHEDEYMVAGGGREYIIIDDDYCWLHFGSRDIYEDYDNNYDSEAAKHIAKLRRMASKESVADVSFKEDILDGGSAVAAVFDSKNMSDILNVEWGDFLADAQYNDFVVGATLSLEGAAMEASLQLFSKDGDEIKLYPWAGNVNAEFAEYINSKDMLVVASATNPEYNWEKLIRALEEGTGDEMPKEYRAKVLEALTSMGGTISYAVGIENIESLLNKDLSGLTFMSMMEFKDGKPKELLDELAQNLKVLDGTNNVSVKYDNSVLEVSVMGTIFKAEVKDGKLWIANRPLREMGNSLMPKSYFDGKAFAARFALPKDNQFVKMVDLTGDLLIDLSCDGNELLARVDFSDVNGSVGVLDFLFTKGQELIAPKYINRFENMFSKFEVDASSDYNDGAYGVDSIAIPATDSAYYEPAMPDSAQY